MKTFVSSLVLLFILITSVAAQSPNTGTLIVAVMDQTGAAVKDARVSVTNTATGAVRGALHLFDGVDGRQADDGGAVLGDSFDGARDGG